MGIEDQTFKIKSYEPFLIGITLNPSINLEIFKNKLASKYSSSEIHEQSINVGYPMELIGVKNDVQIKFNSAMQGISLEGNQPNDVLNTFEELLQLIKDMDYNPEFAVNFYDLRAVISGKTGDVNPQDIINNLTSISNLEKFGKYDTKVGGITVNNLVGYPNKFLAITIEPRVVNPTELYFVNIVYRTNKFDDLKEFIDDLEINLNDLISSLEGKHVM